MNWSLGTTHIQNQGKNALNKGQIVELWYCLSTIWNRDPKTDPDLPWDLDL